MNRHLQNGVRFALQRTAMLAVVATLMTATSSLHAQENVPSTEQFQREINDARNVAEEARQMFAQLEFNAKEAGDVADDDIAQAKLYFDGFVKRWTTVSELFEQNKPDEARKMMSDAWSTLRGRDRWRERIGIRIEQVRTAPKSQDIRREQTWTGQDVYPALFDYIERSKAVSEAWGKLADSMTPEASEEDIRLARQAVNAANSEREIAGAQLHWAREAAGLKELRGVTTELDDSLRALETVQDQMVENMRARVELERKRDDTEAARRAALDEARKAADVARKAKEEAERAK